MILKNIYNELVQIRNELQAIKSCLEPKQCNVKIDGMTISRRENAD